MFTNKEKGKSILLYIAAFFSPVVLMVFIWQQVDVSPLGSNTPLSFDLQAQFMPFIASLRYLFEDGGNFVYSWSNSLGGNNMGQLAYYCASPLNLITLLFPIGKMPLAIYCLTLIKIGLCGLTFLLFLRKGLRDCRTVWYVQLVFACCYALMSYNVLYALCLMWLDGVILLPLLLLGIEELLRGKRGGFFCVFLTALFFSNFYISYMVGAFAGLYFVFRLFTIENTMSGKERGLVIGRFVRSTVCAFLLAMPLLLPALLSLSKGKGTIALRATQKAYSGDVLMVLRKLLPMQYDGLSVGHASIYCGTVMLLLVAMYFFRKKPGYENGGALCLLGIPFLGFIFPWADYIWNGFREPIGLMYRYAFVFSAAVLVIAYQAVVHIPIERYEVRIGVLLACIFTVGELFFNGSVLVKGIQTEAPYMPSMAYNIINTLYEPLTGEVRKEKGFYRMGDSGEFYSVNDAILYGMNGVDFFSSTYNENVNSLMKKLGCVDDLLITTKAEAAGPVVDSLLGIKYRIGTSLPNGNYEEIFKSSRDTMALKLYENKDALSLGFMAQEKLPPIELGANVYENQNLIVSALLGEETEVFHRIPVRFIDQTEGNRHIQYAFRTTGEDEIYCYPNIYLEMQGSADLYFDGVQYGTVGARTIRESQYFGVPDSTTEHTVDIVGDILQCDEIYLYRFDREVYNAVIKRLGENQWQITEFRSGRVKGNVHVESDNKLCTTIPYDTGYTILVDGKKQPYDQWLNTFLCFDLSQGEHTIEVSYCPSGLLPGVLCFVVGVILSCVFYLVGGTCRRDKSLRQNAEEA